MNWLIDEKIKSDSPLERDISICLNANKSIHGSNINYPIRWTGLIAGQKIDIIQKTDASITIDDFEVISFPEKYKELLSRIVDFIDNISDY